MSGTTNCENGGNCGIVLPGIVGAILVIALFAGNPPRAGDTYRRANTRFAPTGGLSSGQRSHFLHRKVGAIAAGSTGLIQLVVQGSDLLFQLFELFFL